ncbi:MAG: glycoside hydrolase family 76 [Thermoleophilia bacterium]|nr:glycoside hydrolase family 76 [Thermoleophilia bacterium]
MLVGAAPIALPQRPQADVELPGFEHPASIADPAGSGFGRSFVATLPMPARWAVSALDGAVRAGVDAIVPEESDTPDGSGITAPLDRAKEAQRALVDQRAMFGDQDRFRGDGAKVWATEAWSLGQVLHGRVALAMQGGSWDRVDNMFRDLETYRVGDGFAGGLGSNDRYYDDNAWIGLAAVQAFRGTGQERYLEHAEQTFRMVRTGQHDDGGLYWFEGDRTGRHTCSVAPAAELALDLYESTGKASYLQFAKQQAAWLDNHLRLPTGLYADNLNDSGQLGSSIYSYNQGTPIGLDVGLYRATGEQRYLERAKATAKAALQYYGTDDRLWKEAPVFNAIFFRNLLALHAVAPDPAYLHALDGYLDRAWTQARNPETGIFDRGDIGHYEDRPGSVIDQGALSQLYAVRALPPSQWARLT